MTTALFHGAEIMMQRSGLISAIALTIVIGLSTVTRWPTVAGGADAA
jgi:hypothetical protein